MTQDEKDSKYKGHKPADNHPWKRSKLINKEISDWTRKSSVNPYTANWKIGGGISQK